MNNSKIRDIATSLTTVIFVGISISGVMLYFKFFSGQVKELHEVLGLAFVAAALLHVLVNFKSMKKYFSKKIFIGSFLIIAIISGVFISQSLNRTKDPKRLVIHKVIEAPIKDSLIVLGVDYDEARVKLFAQNIKDIDKKSIGAIAKANKTSPFKIIAIITAK